MEEKDYVNDDSFKNGFNPFGSKTVGIVLLLVIIFGGLGCGYFFYIKPNYIDKNTEYIPDNNLDINPTVEISTKGFKFGETNKDITNDYINTLLLDIYYDQESKVYSVCKKDDKTCKGTIFRTVSIKVKDDVDYFSNYSNKFIVYRDDNKIKLYDIYRNESFYTDINCNYSEYKIVGNNDSVLGLTYKDNDKYYYYSFVSNSSVFNEGYNRIDIISNGYIVGYIEDCINDIKNGNYYSICTQKYVDIISTKDNKKAKTIIIPVTVEENVNNEINVSYYNVKDNEGYIIIEPKNVNKACKEIYNSELKLIVNCSDNEVGYLDENSVSIDTDGLLHVTKGDIVTIYDTTGKVITTRTK